MVKKTTSKSHTTPPDSRQQADKKKMPLSVFFSLFLGGLLIGVCILLIFIAVQFEVTNHNKIYPGVRVDGISFGGKSQQDVENYFAGRNSPFEALSITLAYEDQVATISGHDLKVRFDGKLSAVQAYSIGRSHNVFSDTYQKWKAATSGINLTSVLSMNTDIIDDTLTLFASHIDTPPQDALFQFENGKASAFKPSLPGRHVNREEAKRLISSYITTLAQQNEEQKDTMIVQVPVEQTLPKITTENSNEFGIRELLSVGTSTFAHSIPGRIHNVELAAKRLNGHIIPPGSVFSFNTALGDVSASTGFAPAYVIQNGRTVLGDGGGVCQVSTTLFRAALNAGLPIVERHAHAYRVGYYEQDSPPGLDATVYAPSVDFKIKNDTQHYILIQTKTDLENLALTFELYGTRDGRTVELSEPVMLSQSAPLPDVFQDDPTLAKDQIKQVDWKAPGARTQFTYKVIKNGTTVIDETFSSNYRPWASVFLKGTKEG